MNADAPSSIDGPTMLSLMPGRIGSWTLDDAVVRPRPRVPHGEGRIVDGDYRNGARRARLTLTDLGAPAVAAEREEAGAAGKGNALKLTLAEGYTLTVAADDATPAELRQLAAGIDRKKLAAARKPR